MLKPGIDEKLLVEYRNVVAEDSAKSAFDVLLEWARSSKSLECFPKKQGYIRSFRYFRDTAWEFAFIPNAKWVLFYFRSPVLKRSKFTRGELLSRFPDAKELKGGDVSLRIHDPDRARAVVEYAAS